MIIGVIPVGGKGSRLGLPFSKEMLPQRNCLYYDPIINHLVEKMTIAGAEEVFFIHGPTFKNDIKFFFKSDNFKHILQKDIGFAKVFKCLHDHIKDKARLKTATILFGLPDVHFDGNPFFALLREDSVSCALFKTDPETKVDRLLHGSQKFEIKSIKTATNSDFFWGAIKFDHKSFHKAVIETDFLKTTEVGDILNSIPDKKAIYFNEYIDIGTWKNLNAYWKSTDLIENKEIEKKYLADEISFQDFDALLSSKNPKEHIRLKSFDYYFAPNKDNSPMEFVRYRDGGVTNEGRADITIKNKSKTISRFELTLPMVKHDRLTDDALIFLQSLGCNFKFKVLKDCSIYVFSEYSIVLYAMDFMGKTVKFLEVELLAADANLIEKSEKILSPLSGFDKNKVIKESKFSYLKQLNDIV